MHNLKPADAPQKGVTTKTEREWYRLKAKEEPAIKSRSPP